MTEVLNLVKVTIWKDKGFLNGDFARLRQISLELPGFRKFVNDSLMFEISGKNVEFLCTQSNLTWSPEASEMQKNYLVQKEREKLAQIMKSEVPPEEMFQFKTTPFEHQKKAFFLGKDAEFYGYFMEMGTGKTKVVIDNGAYLYSQNSIDCMIIVAPNGVHAQWIDEQLPVHLPDWIVAEKAIYRASNTLSQKRIQSILGSTSSDFKIVSFNIESLSNKKGIETLHKFLTKFRCLFVIDESTRIKTPGSMRTKNALKLAGFAKYRRIMSGAPMTKGYEDLYSQLKFLHPDVLGFNSFYTFRNYYCIMGGFESREIVGYRDNAIKDLQAKIDTYSFRITKEECLNLPDKIYMKRNVELTPRQIELYDLMEDDLLQELDGSRIDTPMAITKLLRLQQIICGHIVDDDEKLHEIESNRLDVLMECVEEAQGKVIIWSRFIHDIHQISKALDAAKIGHVLYYGDVKQIEREANIQKFKKDPEIKIFLANPQAGGTGLNLAEATTMIYYSNDFNADTRWQSEDRAHRIGQKQNLTIIDIVAKATVDVKILHALKSKKNLADALLDDPRQFKEKRRDLCKKS